MCSILVQSCSKFAINSVAERMIHRSHALTYAHRFAIYFNSSYAKFPCNDVNHEYTIAMMAIIKDSQKNIKFNFENHWINLIYSFLYKKQIISVEARRSYFFIKLD